MDALMARVLIEQLGLKPTALFQKGCKFYMDVTILLVGT